ncbi:MAG TPA: thermonuclease family protein [Microvirga sp.]|nr:thermonuclease family protein [Microvirga sp.]
MEDRITGVAETGEVALASGRIARLADLRWPDAAPPRGAALAWLRERSGEAVMVRGGAADRWNRVPAQIAPTDASPPAGFARHLVERGLALVDPGEAEALCDPALLAVEAEARHERRGLWADERVLAADDPPALRRRIGAFAIVEGRVRSVGERERRTYLDFGRAWSENFTVTIPKRAWTVLTAGGLSAAALRGRRVRVRGVIEEWNGPALTLQAPEALELLDREAATR